MVARPLCRLKTKPLTKCEGLFFLLTRLGLRVLDPRVGTLELRLAQFARPELDAE